MARSPYDPETLPIGVIGRPHGLRGEVVLRPHNPESADLGRVTALILERGEAREERRVSSMRRFADNWLVKFDGIDSPEAAVPLTNRPVRVRRASLPPPVDGEFFIEDVVGCAVRTEDQRALGVVDEVFWNGAHDVMIVKGETDGSETLIPLVPSFVLTVDVPARQILVAWGEGADG